MEQTPHDAPALFPISMSLQGESVIVVGGGKVAERKIHALMRCGASVTIIAPELTAGLSQLVADGRVTHIGRAYASGDLAGAVLAIAAVDDETVGASVAEEAVSRKIPINVVDRPELCTFFVPAVARRGRLTIAISTGGASPAWASLIRRRLSDEFGDEYARLFDALASIRRRCLDSIPDPRRRRDALQGLADESLIDRALALETDALEEELWRRITQETAE